MFTLREFSLILEEVRIDCFPSCGIVKTLAGCQDQEEVQRRTVLEGDHFEKLPAVSVI